MLGALCGRSARVHLLQGYKLQFIGEERALSTTNQNLKVQDRSIKLHLIFQEELL